METPSLFACGDRIRYLLADEVGLGETIEAVAKLLSLKRFQEQPMRLSSGPI
ncbi:MAG: hypothetical protein KME12_22895 [Trichocoleus desertorum ATA4-8-CV12]|nr:hypothetical protein [Trichocoleus desertorum ATA4-8-CV12]